MTKTVNIITDPDPNWILARLARNVKQFVLDPQLDVTVSGSHREADLTYYVNYALFLKKSSGLDVGFFTHISPEAEELVLSIANQLDHCVSMSSRYHDWMIASLLPPD